MNFFCQACGVSYNKWQGRCNGCGAWNTILEHSETKSSLEIVKLKDCDEEVVARMVSSIKEFDRVCGGGLVPGSVVLACGDPGIGKSTLLLQLAANMSERYNVLYVSGEEGTSQIKMRAQRLNLPENNLGLASTNSLDEILSSLPKGLNLLIVDSVQTIGLRSVEGYAGGISQIRSCVQNLTYAAKSNNMVVILVGHVTKDGAIAGPRFLEHMVDAVFYFEGDRGQQFRVLRSVKNRFGPTDEVGVFVMKESGLIEVTNPSEMLLHGRNKKIPGTVIYAGLEGTRTLLVEVQALIAQSSGENVRRTVVGFDLSRLAMIIAVLEARCNIKIGAKDVFINVVGGVKITDPGLDLAVAIALFSTIKNLILPEDLVCFGELGLTGEVRGVARADLRIKESIKLGFNQAFCPFNNDENEKVAKFLLYKKKNLKEFFDILNEKRINV